MISSLLIVRTARRERISVSILWFAVLAILSGWLLTTSTGTLREQLKTLQFWSLEACLFVWVVSGVYIIRGLAQAFRRIDAIRMAVLAAVALALTLFVAPRTNRIFYDEQIYQGVGQNLADLRRAQVCNAGQVEYGRLECWSGEYNKQPYGYPHILSLWYRMFGVSPAVAFGVNAAAMAAIVCALYALIYLLFADRDAAFFSAFILAIVPQQIIWSATAAVEPTSSLACVLALLFIVHFTQSGTTGAMMAAAAASAYAIQFRPESLLILPVAGLLAWPRLKSELNRPRTWWVCLLFTALVSIHIAHLYAMRNEPWGTADSRFSFHYVASNLRTNGWFYLGDQRFPVAVTGLALIGFLQRRWARERLAMAMYFLLFWGVGLLFYAGSFNYGADVRYSLMTYPPIAAAAGVGLSRLLRDLSRSNPNVPGRALATALVGFQFLWYAPLVRATTEEGWAARADVRVAREMSSELPPNSYVLTHNPDMFHVWGVSAGQMSQIVDNPSYVKFLTQRFTGGVYIHWNFWCNVQEPTQPEVCRKALSVGDARITREYRERDQRFAFYRLRPAHESN